MNSMARITRGQRGAVSELHISMDLMANGWEVYRAVSPSSSCDLLIYKNGQKLRVEVRTALGFGKKDIGRSEIVATFKDGFPEYYWTPNTPGSAALRSAPRWRPWE